MLFEIKEDVNLNDMRHWDMALMYIFADLCRFCQLHDSPLTITSLISDRDNVLFTSRTHAEGRAFDIRTHHYSSVLQHKIVHHLNTKYKDWGAISSSDHKSRVAVLKPDHIHIQVRPNADINRYIKEDVDGKKTCTNE